MRFAFCVEDPSDQEVLSGIMGRVLGDIIEPAQEQYRFKMRGFSKALKLASSVARHAYHKGLDGAVFAIDNDGTPPHLPGHAQTPQAECRVCQLRQAAAIHEPASWPRPALPPLQFLFAVPLQTIESWLLHVQGYDFKGQAETLGADANGRKKLKQALYGTSDPDGRTMRETSRPLTERLVPTELARQSASFRYFLDQLEAIKPANPASANSAASSQG
jgi:hypothetical protein